MAIQFPSFGGQTLVFPGVYSSIIPQTNLPNTNATPPILLIGSAAGGNYNTPYTFSSWSDLLTFARGGNIANYIPYFTQPSPVAGVSVSNNIIFINVSNNVPSTLTVNTTVAGSNVVLEAANPGAPSNLLNIQIAANSEYSVAMDVTLIDGYSNAAVGGVGLGVPFLLAYNGSASSGVTYNITATEFVLSSPNPGESFTFSLGAFSTMSQLVTAINETGVYEAVLFSSTDGNLPTSAWSESYATLPSAPIALSPPTSGQLNYAAVVVGLPDFIYWVQNIANSLVSIKSINASANAWPLVTMGVTYFTGGQTVAPQVSDYANGFATALNVPAWIVWCDSDSYTVQLLGAEHAKQASQAGVGGYRRFITGSVLGATPAQAIEIASALSSKETTFVYPGLKVINNTTQTPQVISGHAASAMVASFFAGQYPSQSIINVPLNATGVEQSLTAAQIQQLLSAGVMVLAQRLTNSAPSVVQDVTTWQADSNPVNVFNMLVGAAQWTAYTLNNSLQKYIGQPSSPQTLANLQQDVKKTLNALIYSTSNPIGVLASWNPNSLQVSYNGNTQSYNVSVEVQLINEGNYVLITLGTSAYGATNV